MLYLAFNPLVTPSAFVGVDGGVQCSGTLIGSRHILTAAHCVIHRDPATGILRDADVTLVTPGLNANSAPYGSFLAKGPNTRTPSRYVEMMLSNNLVRSYQFDMALLELDQSGAGDPPGWLNYTSLSSPIGARVTLAGYPNDFKESPLASQFKSLFFDGGIYQRYFLPELSRVIAHRVNGVSGMSGGSMTIWTSPNDSHAIVGLFVGSSKDERTQKWWNIATVLDQEMVGLIDFWRNPPKQ